MAAKKSTVVGRGASLSTGGRGVHGDRYEGDFYATPPETTEALLDRLTLNGSILEPACGMGHISEVLRRYYPTQEVVSTDLYNRGYGQTGIDFLTHDYGRRFDTIITNPPYSLAQEFVERGLQIANDRVIMLLKIQFLESRKRKAFLESSPLRYVYVFSERQSTWRGGMELNPETGKPWSTTLLLAWFVWEQGYLGEPTIRWI